MSRAELRGHLGHHSHVCVCVCVHAHTHVCSSVQLFATPWTVGHQAPLSMGFLRQEYWVGKIPWKRKWQSTPVFLTGESHEQKSLVGYSSWGCKELELLTRTCTHTHTHTHGLNCSAACGIFLDQGLNPCLLYQQADSLPLRNQGSPLCGVFTVFYTWCHIICI